MKLEIKGIPMSKQSARFAIRKGKDGKNFVHSYQDIETTQNERNIKAIIISQLPKGFKPFQKAVAVNSISYIFPALSTFNKKAKTIIATGGKVYKTTKPDLSDNLNKALFDAMQGVIYLNDSQICKIEKIEKIYGDVPGITINIEEIEICQP